MQFRSTSRGDERPTLGRECLLDALAGEQRRDDDERPERSLEEYEAFIEALRAGEAHEGHDWDAVPYFEGCLPIEVMAERGADTLRYGPLKPVGLTNAHKPNEKPYAVIQLRQDNALGTLYNMVGFQTKLRYGAQGEVLRMIPGLENAEFARLGGLHRNTFLNSPKVLDASLRLKADPRLRFATATTEDFRSVCETVSGRDLEVY